MRLSIDEAADALHLELVDVEVAESEEVAPGIVVDYDANGEIVGLEVLHLSKRPHPVDVLDFQFQTHRKPQHENSSAHVAA
ncbi:MAG TPA: DUF2283 domain-containing protein [Candidatus Acidoferrales bacterium]|nr:DUF2283 domain-containing protein [Candidatus Acidoferrales bacterium]